VYPAGAVVAGATGSSLQATRDTIRARRATAAAAPGMRGLRG